MQSSCSRRPDLAVVSYLKYKTVQRRQGSKTTKFPSSSHHQSTVQVDKNEAITPERAVWYSFRLSTTWVQSLVCCSLCLFPGLQNVYTYLGGNKHSLHAIHSNTADERASRRRWVWCASQPAANQESQSVSGSPSARRSATETMLRYSGNMWLSGADA